MTHGIFSPAVLIMTDLSLDRGLFEDFCVFKGSNSLSVKEYVVFIMSSHLFGELIKDSIFFTFFFFFENVKN